MNEAFKRFIKKVLDDIETTIYGLEFKKRGSFVNWLNRYNNYINQEKEYVPKRDNKIRYKRGMVIHVDFGYRVGDEYGGRHWAVVINPNDSIKSGILNVVPLSSIKEGKSAHPIFEADLGTIEGLNEKRAKALIAQVTTISKLRISDNQTYKLTSEQLDKIDEKLIKQYTKQ